VTRDPKEGDRNWNCRGSCDQDEDTCNEGMRGKGFRNSEKGGQGVVTDQNGVIGGRTGDGEYVFRTAKNGLKFGNVRKQCCGDGLLLWYL